MFIGSANIVNQILRLKSFNSSQISQQILAPPQRSCGKGDLLLRILPVTPASLCPGALTAINLARTTRSNQGNHQSVLRPHRKDLRLGLLFYFRLIVSLGELGESVLLNIG